MREKGIISTNQYIWILFCIITAFTTLNAPTLLIFQSGRDSWLAVVFAWFLDVLLAIVYAYMGIRFPGQSIPQYSMSILGKVLGKIIGIIFPVYFLLVSSIIQTNLSMILQMFFFERTPFEIILGASYIVIGYAVLKGVEVIGRVCEILGPIYLLSIILLSVFLIQDIEIKHLKPQLEYGLYPALSGSLIILAFISICIIMGVYSSICNHPEDGFKAKFAAVSMGSFIIILTVTICIGIFAFPQSQNMYALSLRVIRVVHIGEFLERVETQGVCVFLAL
jgi:spore germination protein (amino acid permease)